MKSKLFNKIFSFKKGKHYSRPINIRVSFNKTKMTRAILFNEDLLNVTKQENVLDWNKLFGFSRGFHHENSFRFSWREDGDNLYVAPYTYINGIRYYIESEDRSVKLKLNKIYVFEIQIIKHKVFYTIFDSRNNLLFHKSYIIRNNLPLVGYDLNPYFGGTTTPLKDFSIAMNTKF